MPTINQLNTPQGAKVFLNEIPEICRKNLIDAIESNAQKEKQNKLLSTQQEILSNPNMQDYHRYVLIKMTNNLVENKHQAELEQLNKGIGFTEKGGLIVHTSLGDIKFLPKQATFNDIKDIEGIQEGKNVFTENTTTGEIGLWVNSDAIKKIANTDKKVFSTEQYLDIREVFSGLNNLYKCNEIFFDLLGAKQYGVLGLLNHNRHENMNRFLCTDTGTEIVGDYMYNNGIKRDSCDMYCSGIWFIED